MRLADLVTTSEKVAATRKRTEKVALLAALLAPARGDDAALAASFLAGILPRGKVGVGAASLFGATPPPAAEPTLTLAGVDHALAALAAISGKGARGERERTLGALFARATEAEQRFLARLFLGELRQGALASLVVDAVAAAYRADPALARRAFMLAGDFGVAARAAADEGAAGLARFDLVLFRPVQPMLAQTAEDPADAIARLGVASFERKLDGARVQVHKANGDVRIYTRNLNDVTSRLPEVVARVLASPARELVLDGEAIALLPDGRPRPFQVTMRRFGAKSGGAEARDAIPLTPVFFDCLYADGASLLARPARDRHEALDALLPPENVLARTVTGDPEVASAVLHDALAMGHEGVMAKALDAPYDAGSRGGSWLKLKTAHTLDLAVIAAEWGSGRRERFLSNLHLAARDEATGELVMLGKTFKGLTDPMLAFQTERLLGLATQRDEHVVRVRPELVVEIAVNEIQESPRYPAGLALRFARVKRYRLDKGPGDVDTLETVRAIHRAGVAAARTAGSSRER